MSPGDLIAARPPLQPARALAGFRPPGGCGRRASRRVPHSAANRNAAPSCKLHRTAPAGAAHWRRKSRGQPPLRWPALQLPHHGRSGRIRRSHLPERHGLAVIAITNRFRRGAGPGVSVRQGKRPVQRERRGGSAGLTGSVGWAGPGGRVRQAALVRICASSASSASVGRTNRPATLSTASTGRSGRSSRPRISAMPSCAAAAWGKSRSTPM